MRERKCCTLWVCRKDGFSLIDLAEYVHQILLYVMVFEKLALAYDGQNWVILRIHDLARVL